MVLVVQLAQCLKWFEEQRSFEIQFHRLIIQISKYTMKDFTISQLLIYDPTKISSKKKPIEIDIQQAKILVYWPEQVPIQQKCNSVGMAEGVFSFCAALHTIKQENKEGGLLGCQVIFMNQCTLILREVEENIWIFIKLQHEQQSKYYRIGQGNQDYYYHESTMDQKSCENIIDHIYESLRIFYGPIRGWVFRESMHQYQKIISSFILKYQEVFRYQTSLNTISYTLKNIRMIPLDVNTTLKFLYFKNVVQSYDKNICYLAVFAHGVLAYSSIDKEATQYFANYFFSNGQPYSFSQNRKSRLTLLSQIPISYLSQKFGYYYNSKIIGFEDGSSQAQRSSLQVSKIQGSRPERNSLNISKTQGNDLLGLQDNRFQLFDIYIKGQNCALKINFYHENSMLFITLYKANPSINQLIFQNRFYHDNADKFLMKVNQHLNTLLKPNDPYKFIFHNLQTYTGKSSIKEWKNIGNQIRDALGLLLQQKEGITVSMTNQGYWLYGIRRLSRVIILLIPNDLALNKLQQYFVKMSKQYFSKAYI